MRTITGSIYHIIFRNPESGYTVAEFALQDDDATGEPVLITVTGTFGDVREGEQMTLEGDWKQHAVYGEQFCVCAFTQALPQSRKALINYLSSGVLPGVGEQMAAQLADRYGHKIFDVLEKSPRELLKIKGIGPKTLDKMLAGYRKEADRRGVMLRLQEYDIAPGIAAKLYERYKEETVEKLLRDPYGVLGALKGVGFVRADALARRLGCGHDDEKRVAAGIAWALQACYRKGHTYLPQAELIREAAVLLTVEEAAVEHALDAAVFSGRVKRERVDGENVYYPAELFQAESDAALATARLACAPVEKNTADTQALLRGVETDLGFALDPCQREAIEAACTSPLTVITGGPGTGKTTIITGILKLFAEQHIACALAAPTGRAAQRMTQATGEEAKTIHRLLEYDFVPGQTGLSFKRDHKNPLDAQAVIIDESSMIDIQLYAALLDAVAAGTRLIFVGDADQLPSVGPGNVLADLIASGAAKTVRLKDIHRQENGSRISTNAHAINEGVVPEIDNHSDFMLINKNSEDVALATIIEMVAERMPRAFGYDRMQDIQVICPLKKGTLGTNTLNTELQKALNPPGPDKRERASGGVVFREGDKIMQVRNNYNLKWENPHTGLDGQGVYNGDIGIIRSIRDDCLSVCFSDGRIGWYPFDQLDELSHAYAITVHKSQGSEFAAVVMPLVHGYSLFMNRRLLYTGVTRAKKTMILTGRSRYFSEMIHNDLHDRRNTALKARIEAYMRYEKNETDPADAAHAQ